MTKDEALREAIDTLKSTKHGNCDYAWIDETIEKCTAALAQPKQEPVAKLFGTLPVFDTPPAAQRPWVGLTDDDWEHIGNKKGTALDTFAQGAVWAANQLKERNA